jgi:hypothetical protein
MKHILKLIQSTLLIAIITAGCDTDELHNMNLNPNAVNQIDLNYFLSASELGMASNGSSGDNRYTDWRTNINFASFAIQQFASTGQTSGEKYFDGDVEPCEAPFQFYYRDALRRTAEILKQTSEGGYMAGRLVNTRQAARIIRVFDFHRLTDWYGSIPYTEANKGLAGIFQPKYDKQKDIYTDMLKELDEACAAFNDSDIDYAGFKKADFIFNGDVAKWKKFGYSLMLRLAMRVSNVDAAMASTYVTKAVAGGTMTSNDDIPWVKMTLTPSEWMNQNGISRAFYPGDGGAWQGNLLSKTLIDKLKGTNKASTADDDPRLMIFTGGIVSWTANSVTPIELDPLKQEGMPSGLDGSQINLLYGTGSPPVCIPYRTFSSVNFKMMQDDEPYQLMNPAESELLKAEALVRSIGSGISGTAQSHYEAGVKLAMQLYTVYDASLAVTDAQVATYLAAYPYNAATALEQIGTQMWLSKFMMWWEAWSDWRRTGFPVLVPSNYPGNSTGGVIPTKLTLPSVEAAGNPNYAAGATKPDKLTTKVWWDGGDE